MIYIIYIISNKLFDILDISTIMLLPSATPGIRNKIPH